MYFSFDGSIIACCYTRKNVLGKYPENRIYDTWFGERFKSLRNDIKSYDLSSGCEICRNQIQDRNYSGTKAHLYDALSSDKSIFPSVLEFELDNKCNLECLMCTGKFSSSIQKNREKSSQYESPYNSEFVDELSNLSLISRKQNSTEVNHFLLIFISEIWEKIIEINPKCRIFDPNQCNHTE